MTRQLSPTARALLSVFVANTIFGVSFIFTKVALAQVTPFVLLACRFLVALCIFTVMMLAGRIKITLRDKPWKLLLLLGILPVIYFSGETYGVLYTSATFSAIVIALIPIASIWASALFLKESPTARQSVFCCLSVLGVIVITASSAGGSNHLKGVLFLLLAVFADVFFNLLTRKLSVAFTPFARTYIMFVMGFLVFFLLSLHESGGSLRPILSALSNLTLLLPILYLGIASSVVAFFLINYANTLLPVTRTIVFINVTTLVSVIIGVCYLHEPFSPIALGATGLIVLGIWGVQRYAGPAALPTEALIEEDE